MAKMKDCSNRGKLMVMIGLLVIAPVAILPFYPQDMDYTIFFLLPGLISILAGGLVCAFGKRESYFSSDRLTAQRHSNNTVLFTWFWGIAVGAMPPRNACCSRMLVTAEMAQTTLSTPIL